MNWRAQGYLAGVLMTFVGLTLLVPFGASLLFHDGTSYKFLGALIASVSPGLFISFLCRPRQPVALSKREALFAVGLCWIVATCVGALPYVFAGVLDPAGAIFESSSGFTTTGASVFTDVEIIPPSLLLWRSMTQWIGGMGIIVLSLAILPQLGIAGMQLYQAEVPGPMPGKLTPRMQDTAKWLWTVYIALTALNFLALLLTDMGAFDALNHCMATLATGGFSTRNASLAAFSPMAQWVSILFMFLAGINFTLHYQFVRHHWNGYTKDGECLTFLGLTGICTLFIMLVLFMRGNFPLHTIRDFEVLLRTALFQVISLGTTTGFASADYVLWPAATIPFLLLVTFVGGCVGSTAGGFKVMRLLVLGKILRQELFHILHPHAVRHIRMDGRIIPPPVLKEIRGFFLIYTLMLFLIATAAMLLTEMDFLTAISGTLTCISNVGPGFGALGPVCNFGWVTAPTKLLFSFAMLLGRLEFYALIIIFVPEFWRH